MSVTNAMEKTRLALHHIGKLLFAQCTELINPTMNRGLPPNLAATDPSHNYFAKGIDIHAAAYVGELGYLANPVSTHVQSAEMHNQAVNSLALISARATLNALEVLSLLTSSYLYALCQALDLRALQHEFQLEADTILREEVTRFFGPHLSGVDLSSLVPIISRHIRRSFEATSTMDASLRMRTVAAATTTPLVDFCAKHAGLAALDQIVQFRETLAQRMASSLTRLREQYLNGEVGSVARRTEHAVFNVEEEQARRQAAAEEKERRRQERQQRQHDASEDDVEEYSSDEDEDSSDEEY